MTQLPRHTARGLVIHNGKVLLMERWRDDLHYFSIPGGGIEPGETPETAAIREIFEETQVTARAVRPVLEMHDGPVVHHIYLCEYVSGEPVLATDAPEALHATEHNRFKPGWVDTAKLPDIPMIYWEPLRRPLVAGIKEGFPDKVTIVRTGTTR